MVDFIANPKTLVAGTLAKSSDVNTIVNAIFTGLQDVSKKVQLGKVITGIIENVGDVIIDAQDSNEIIFKISSTEVGKFASDGTFEAKNLLPVGSIIPFYDYNAALTFDTDYWAYCDGSSKTVTGIGVQVLPDLSGRYLVGFGTDGAGDMDSATWSTTPAGQAGHTINLQHSHTVDGHTHTGPSHTHGAGTFLGPSHIHGAGTFLGPSHTHDVNIASFNTSTNGEHDHSVMKYITDDVGNTTIYFLDGNVWTAVIRSATTLPTDGYATETKLVNKPSLNTTYTFETSDDGDHWHSVNPPNTTSTSSGTGAVTGSSAAGGTGAVTGSSAAGGTAATGSATPGMDNQLSTVQSIQPRSIKVRYIMKIK